VLLETPVLPLPRPAAAAVNTDTQSWRGVVIVFDSERTPKDSVPTYVGQRHISSLIFESRFESGNLRQARRV